jgi:hypothetical protein
VQRWIKEGKCLGKVGKVREGPKGSLASFHRVSQSSGCSCNRVYELLQEVCRGSTGCSVISTGCSVILLQDVYEMDF